MEKLNNSPWIMARSSRKNFFQTWEYKVESRDDGRDMIEEAEYQILETQFPCLKRAHPKQVDILRDLLKPSDGVVMIADAQYSAGPGILCLTEIDLHLLWTQKMFFFFKFPAVQTLHRQNLNVRRIGNSLEARSGEEEASFELAATEADIFLGQLQA